MKEANSIENLWLWPLLGIFHCTIKAISLTQSLLRICIVPMTICRVSTMVSSACLKQWCLTHLVLQIRWVVQFVHRPDSAHKISLWVWFGTQCQPWTLAQLSLQDLAVDWLHTLDPTVNWPCVLGLAMDPSSWDLAMDQPILWPCHPTWGVGFGNEGAVATLIVMAIAQIHSK